MNQQANWVVRQASVVLLAERPIDVQTLTPETLEAAGVTPPDWRLVEQTEGSNQPFISYDNSVTISSQNNRCVFRFEMNNHFVDDYKVHDLARRYVDANKLIQYRFIGINWNLHASVPDSTSWIHSKLLASNESLRNFDDVEISLTTAFGISLCNLTFTNLEAGVELDSNYHFDLSGITPTSVLAQWTECHQHLQHQLSESF